MDPEKKKWNHTIVNEAPTAELSRYISVPHSAVSADFFWNKGTFMRFSIDVPRSPIVLFACLRICKMKFWRMKYLVFATFPTSPSTVKFIAHRSENFYLFPRERCGRKVIWGESIEKALNEIYDFFFIVVRYLRKKFKIWPLGKTNTSIFTKLLNSTIVLPTLQSFSEITLQVCNLA